MNPIENSSELTQQKIKKFEILKTIEKKEIKRRSFRSGFVFGFFVTYLIIGLAILTFLPSKKKIISGGLNFIMADYFEEIIKAVPDGYVTKNKEKLLNVLDLFVNSAAKNYVSKSEYRQILLIITRALQDGILQYQELDSILNAMERAASASD